MIDREIPIHSIADIPALHAAIAIAARHAQAGCIATLGIPPTRPDTGFGYIRLGDALDDGRRGGDGDVGGIL